MARVAPGAPPKAAASSSMRWKFSALPRPRPPLTTTLASSSDGPSLNAASQQIKILDRVEVQSEGPSLEDASVVVSGGERWADRLDPGSFALVTLQPEGQNCRGR